MPGARQVNKLYPMLSQQLGDPLVEPSPSWSSGEHETIACLPLAYIDNITSITTSQVRLIQAIRRSTFVLVMS